MILCSFLGSLDESCLPKLIFLKVALHQLFILEELLLAVFLSVTVKLHAEAEVWILSKLGNE